MAIAIAISFRQLFRCLHPSAKAAALFRIVSNANLNLNLILSPVINSFFNINYVENYF